MRVYSALAIEGNDDTLHTLDSLNVINRDFDAQSIARQAATLRDFCVSSDRFLGQGEKRGVG